MTIPEVFAPGVWRCAKCEFRLVQSNMNANTGTISARDDKGDKCPNCNNPLWRVSWKDEAREAMALTFRLCDQVSLMKDRAQRAHNLCNVLRVKYPNVSELGDDGTLHDAIHDVLRIETPTANSVSDRLLLLRKIRVIVDFQSVAEHMLDGLGPRKTLPIDDTLRELDFEISALDGR